MNSHDIYGKFREIGLDKVFDIDRWGPYGRGVIKLWTRDKSGVLVFFYHDKDTWELVKTTDKDAKTLIKLAGETKKS